MEELDVGALVELDVWVIDRLWARLDDVGRGFVEGMIGRLGPSFVVPTPLVLACSLKHALVAGLALCEELIEVGTAVFAVFEALAWRLRHSSS